MPHPSFPDAPRERMPANNTIIAGDTYERVAAEIGSASLLRALLRHGASHGLPNITPDQCRARLEAM